MPEVLQTILHVGPPTQEYEYPIVLGSGILDAHLKSWIQALSCKPGKAMLITDFNVFNVQKHGWTDKVKNAFESFGIEVLVCSIIPGEKSKCLDYLSDLLKQLAWQGFTCSDMILAVGGGVVGDLAGFVASVYMHGLRFIQIPTSLLAIVDSSVGGKVSVDFERNKNMLGSFCPPQAVFADLDCLTTLPEHWWRDGIGEILKCLLLTRWNEVLERDPEDLVSKMMSDQASLFDTVKMCIEFKRSVVNFDPLENKNGIKSQKILNFGHTFGHVLEATTNFTISHGRAVMLGILGALGYAVQEGLCTLGELKKVRNLVEASYGSSTFLEVTDFIKNQNLSMDQYVEALRMDKKVRGKELEIVLPPAICGDSCFPRIQVDDLASRFVVPALKEVIDV